MGTDEHIGSSDSVFGTTESWRDEFDDLQAATFPALPLLSSRLAVTDRITQTIPLDHHYRNEFISPATALALAWGLVLSSYAGSQDVLYGLKQHQDEDCQCRSPPLPFRLQLGSHRTLLDIINSCRARVAKLATLAHLSTKDISRLGGEFARVARYGSVLHIKQHSHAEELDDTASVPLTVHCEIQRDGIDIEAIFDSNFIAANTMRMMLHQFSHGMALMTQQSRLNMPVIELTSVSPEGLDKIKQTSRAAPPARLDFCVHHRIAARCRSQPQAPAIVAWDGALTYHQLDELSSRLAHQLLETCPVRPDQLVCVLMEKSMWVAVALLAILKAGGAFLLLDPSQPLDRLKQIRGKAQAPAVLTSSSHRDRASLLGCAVIEVPGCGLRDSDGYDSKEVQPHHALYAIFTSGSTGEPKAAVIEHAAFCTGWDALAPQIHLGSSSRVFQSTSHAFAMSITDYLATLLQGGCVCVPSEDLLQNNFAGAIQSLQANWAVMTPSMARVLDPNSVPSLPTMALVGERLTMSDLEQWATRVRLFSLYGQSETAAGAFVSRKTGLQSPASSLGTLTHAYEGWVVHPDNHDILLPPGAVGELVLEGPVLGRGYLDDPLQTQDKFIQAPVWLHQFRARVLDSHRLFKTGDLVRRLEDGTFELRGRKNITETKLRGQRMDLNEVESHLRQQYPIKPQVAAEIILPSDCAEELHAMLVGFVWVHDPQNTSKCRDEATFAPPTMESRREANDAVARMGESLPKYMVPTVIIPIQNLPLTASGKMHRRRLRELAASMSRKELLVYMKDMRDTKTSAVTSEELTVRDVCAEALGLRPESLGMNIDFASLGGDSLTARRVVALCRRKGLMLTVADIFGAESLAALASKAAESSDARVDDPFAPLKREFLTGEGAAWTEADVEDVFPVQGGQSRELKEVSYFVFHLSGGLDIEKFHHACQMLTQTSATLRSAVVPFNHEWVNVVLRQPACDFRHKHLPRGTDLIQWAESWSIEDKKNPPSTNWPVTQIVLGNADGDLEHFAFIMRLSHTQYDGYSLVPIFSNLWAIYEDKPIAAASSFGDYARRAFQQVQKPETVAYWRALLAGTRLTPLPESPLAPEEETRCITVKRSVELANSPPHGITMATVAKAAWADMMRRRTGDSSIVLTQMINGRDAIPTPDTDLLIGACHSIIPFVVDYARFSTRPTIHDLLRAIQDQYVASLPYGVIDWDFLEQKCTSWPAISRVGFMLAYWDFPDISDMRVGDTLCQCTARFPAVLLPGEAWITVIPMEGGLSTEFCVYNTVMKEAEAEEWLMEYGQTIERFLHNPDAPLDLGE